MKRLALILLLATSALAAPKRYIVEYAPGVRLHAPIAKEARELRHALRASIVEVNDATALHELARRPGVLRVTPDAEVIALGREVETNGTNIDRPSTNATGAGITIAILDSGIDRNHPALVGKVIGGWDFVNDDADPTDDYQHGTHVAGIIAANSEEMTGVAPGVSLLAYKVLGADGRGHVSDILLAIDRALDPNGDGDPSDRADILNLSLGVFGHADDPLSRAVANAVGLGTVVCAAAGNDEGFRRVRSPGVAPLAITVGATERNATIADFNSRGPAPGSGDIKPDIVAPGVGIRSTGLGGSYVTLSGTSMATPYVAGLAALLLELHPQWSPYEIKAALTSTATPLANAEVMEQGSGIVSFDRASHADVFVTTTQLNFGFDGTPLPQWTSTRTLAFRNDSNTTRTFTIGSNSTQTAVTVKPAQTTVTLAPKEVAQIDVIATVNNELLPDPQSASFTFAGALTIAWNGGSARVPWAFIRSARAIATYDGAGEISMVWDVPAGTYGSMIPLSPSMYEVFIEPGTYDLALMADDGGDVRLIVAENQKVEGDVRLNFDAADAPHEIRLAALPDAASGPDKLYSILARFTTQYGSVMLPMTQRVMHASSFSDRYSLLLTEAHVDANAITIAQHPPVRGLAGPTVLSLQPSDFDEQELVLHAPEGSTGRTITIMPRDWPRDPFQFGPRPPSLDVAMPELEWRATLRMSRELHDDYASGVQMSIRTSADQLGQAALITPMVRRDADGFFATRQFEKIGAAMHAVAGEPLEFGGSGTAFMPSLFEINAQGLGTYFEVRGGREELRRVATNYTIFDRTTQRQVAAGSVPYGAAFLPTPNAGLYRATLTTSGGKLTIDFDTRTGNAQPPAIQSLALLDGAGRRATHFTRNGNASIEFTASREVAALTTAFFRRSNGQTWVQLTPVSIGEGRYRIDLADALRIEGPLDVAISLTADDGSSMSWEMPRIITTEEAQPTKRRRAVGRQ